MTRCGIAALLALAGCSPGTSGGCEQLLTPQELAGLAHQPVELRPSKSTARCAATVVAGGRTVGLVTVVDAARWPREIELASRTGGAPQPLELGERGVVIRGHSEVTLGFLRGRAGALVQLSTAIFDDAAVARAIDLLRTRGDVLDR